MVRGSITKKRLRITNKTTGQPAADDIAEALELVLYSNANNTPVKRLVAGEGIIKEAPGVFVVTITADDSLLLPTKGRAYLMGYILPIKRSIKLDLGAITDNLANQ